MSDNLPSIPRKGFFSKIGDFFSKFRYKKEIIKQETIDTKTEVKEVIREKAPNGIEEMKKQGRKTLLKEEIFEIIDKKPELIKTLSDEHLDELNKMYDDVIEENDRKIRELERTLADIE